jgi:hypothetical protein
VRALVERRRRARPPGAAAADADPGILAASGLVAGEGLAGVLVAALVAGQLAPRSMAPRLPGLAGELGALLLLLAICAFLHRAGRNRPDTY